MESGAPLTVAEIGAMVRTYRKASGLSQKDLAHAAGVSRATLNYLESGREDLEIGAGKLFALMSVLGVPVALPAGVDREADERTVSQALAAVGSGKKRLTEADLIEALASGRVREGGEAVVASFLTQVPPGAGAALIRLAAVRTGNPAKEIARNGRALTKSLKVHPLPWLGA